MAWTVADELYHRLRKRQTTKNLFGDLDALSLISSSDVVDLSVLSLLHDHVNGSAVVVYEDPGANILA